MPSIRSAAATLFLLAGCLRSPAPVGPDLPGPKTLTIWHYAIDLPAGYVARNVAGPEDFDLWQIRSARRDRLTCGLYFGNWPRFPMLAWPSAPTETKSDASTIQAYVGSDRLEGLIRSAGLTYHKSSGSPFTVIHYFGEDLEQGTLDDMRRMMSSIRLVKPHLD